MLLVLVMLSALILSLSAAIPAWKTAIQRENELIEIERAHQYLMGIRRYYRKNGRYPISVDQLTQQDGQGLRYLRSAYADPLSPDGKWKIIHYGEAIQAEIVGYRNPLQTAQNGSQGIGLPGSVSAAQMGAPGQPGAGFGQPGGALAAVGGFGGMTPGAAGMLSGFGGGGGTALSGALGTPGAAGIGSAALGGPGMPSGVAGQTGTPGANSAGSSTNTSMFGTASPLTTNGPIIGISSADSKPGVHSFNGYSQPDQWQFVYDPTQDRSLQVPAGGSRLGTNGATGQIGLPGVGPVLPSIPTTIPH